MNKTLKNNCNLIKTKQSPSTDSPIEDAYSIRCTPHIIGPIRESLKWIKSIITNEINSSNDNPLILSEYQEVFHNGHFHGQYISMAMDYLGICLTHFIQSVRSSN